MTKSISVLFWWDFAKSNTKPFTFSFYLYGWWRGQNDDYDDDDDGDDDDDDANELR